MLRYSFHFLLSLLVLAVVAGCNEKDDPDGLWTPMKWERYSYPTIAEGQNRIITVPGEGGTYVFRCKNYSSFWFSSPSFAETEYGEFKLFPLKYEDAEFKCFDNGWCEAVADADSFEVTFQRNTGDVRSALVVVTGGDVFDTFRFRQASLQAQR